MQIFFCLETYINFYYYIQRKFFVQNARKKRHEIIEKENGSPKGAICKQVDID